MINLIGNYISNLSIEDFNNLAKSKDIYLSHDELSYAFRFVKMNWRSVLNDINTFDISEHKEYFSSENYEKICSLVKDTYIKYGHYLK